MFAVEERDRLRERLIELARLDPDITGAAVTGSLAVGSGDRWSDLDLAFAVRGPLGAALERWTGRMYRDFGAVHHWDLPSGSTVYRVFLLPGWLEVDIGFTPQDEFGPRGPNWRADFGPVARPASTTPSDPADPSSLAGLAWHHAWHARVCIQRRRWWQAEYWISAVRDRVLALVCLRSGQPTDYAKGAHLLPERLTAPLEAALVRSLDEAELRRALGAAVTAFGAELRHTDPELADRLRPMLSELDPGGRGGG
ncbi:MAG TPA: hypothetical protein VFX70_01270 [Mycobacteriales bacterium]|nr:hypothetical protein [Mycobacteriales bacterium]